MCKIILIIYLIFDAICGSASIGISLTNSCISCYNCHQMCHWLGLCHTTMVCCMSCDVLMFIYIYIMKIWYGVKDWFCKYIPVCCFNDHTKKRHPTGRLLIISAVYPLTFISPEGVIRWTGRSARATHVLAHQGIIAIAQMILPWHHPL